MIKKMINKMFVSSILCMLLLTIIFVDAVLGTDLNYPKNNDLDEVTCQFFNEKSILDRLDWNTESTSFGLDGKKVHSLAVTESYLFAGTYGDGIYRKNLIYPDSFWEYLGYDSEDINSVYIDPSFPNIIYIGLKSSEEIIDDNGDPHSLYKSMDFGETWTPCDYGIKYVDIADDEFRPSVLCVNSVKGNAFIVFATTSNNQVFKSVNGGETWELIYGPMQTIPASVRVISIDPSDSQILWTGGESTLHQGFISKSTDGGQSWVGVTPDLGHTCNSCYSIIIDPRDTNIVYAGLEGKLAKTTDGGENWSFVLEPDDYPYFCGMVLDPLAPDHIFAGSAPLGPSPFKIWGSGNSGESWRSSVIEIEDGGSSVFALAIDLMDHNIIYAGTWGGGVWRCMSSWTYRRPDIRRCNYD